MRAPSQQRSVTCAICRSKFTTTHSQGKYCSAECRRLGARKTWVNYGNRNADERYAYRRIHYANNRDEVLARTSAYSKTPAGRAAQHISGVRAKAKYPQKIAARQAVTVAIRSGALVRGPCAHCGATGRTHGHHPDYAKPLSVIWLCPPCHAKEHKRIAHIARRIDKRKAA